MQYKLDICYESFKKPAIEIDIVSESWPQAIEQAKKYSNKKGILSVRIKRDRQPYKFDNYSDRINAITIQYGVIVENEII
jgi:hypothetical protein